MKILKTTDRVEVCYDDYKIIVSPLSYAQKLELLDSIKISGGVEIADINKQSFLMIKYGVKEVVGFKNLDDSDYKVDLKDGVLTDNSAQEVLEGLVSVKINDNNSLVLPVFNFLNGKNPKLEGVSIKNNGKEIDLGK